MLFRSHIGHIFRQSVKQQMVSDVPLGSLYYWKVVDIKTGKNIEHKYLGEVVKTHPTKWQKVYHAITEKTRSEFLY